MQSLSIDPPVPFLVPPGPLTMMLVGCGGTGSHIAQSLARLASHLRDGGQQLDLVFVDGDTVERKNVGRQLFGPSDVGKNKAQALAARFSALFGLSITAHPAMLDADYAPLRAQQYTILVGAVDSAEGRRCMADLVHPGVSWSACRLWLDCGNHEAAGQVVLGNAAHLSQLHESIGNGLCARLPAPSLLYPDLLKSAPRRQREDCAAAMEDNAQSLMVNQMMAAIAGQYLYQLAVHRRVTTYETVVDLASLTMRSTPITAANLARATGLSEETLTSIPGVSKKGLVPA